MARFWNTIVSFLRRKSLPLEDVVLSLLPTYLGFIVLADTYFNPLGLVSHREDNIFFYYVSLYSLVIVFLVVYVYGSYPAFFSGNKYFTKKGYKIVTEYQYIKKLLTIWIPIFSFTTIFIYGGGNSYLYSMSQEGGGKHILNLFIYSVIVSLDVQSIIRIGGGLFRIMTQIGKKEFRLYFARGCCMIILKSEDSLVKMNYLLMALDSYNKYLRRVVHFEIKDIGKIYSKLLSLEDEEKANIIKSVSEFLEGSKLELARYLLRLTKIPETELFISEPYAQKIRKVLTSIAVTIPIVIAIIQLIQLIERTPK